MAQLTDDCFAFSGPLLPLHEMERLIGERITPVAETERIALRNARGRVTAADLKAPVNLPPFDNSAVDGYAVRHADLNPKGDTKLVIASRLTAGKRADMALKAGQAVRIFTGAAMPAGADTVFMQEDVTAEGGHVTVPRGLKLGANRRLAGEDAPAGKVVLPAGTVLEAQHIALAAALGLTEVDVRRRLKVAIFSTGDEVVEPGAKRGGAAIYDANRYLLSALLERLGALVTDLGILGDDPAELARALAKAAVWHDLVITSGGVSTGEADHVRGAVERIGSMVFWRVAIKPGRPVAMGVIRAAPGGEAAAAAAGRRVAAKSGAAAGARGFRLQEKERPPRICSGGAAAWARWRNRGGQTSPRWRRHPHVADRNRRLAGISRTRHVNRVGRAGRVFVLCKPDGIAQV
jgi:molybdopterin molybdotransferase